MQEVSPVSPHKGVCSKPFIFFGSPSQTSSVSSTEGLKRGQESCVCAGGRWARRRLAPPARVMLARPAPAEHAAPRAESSPPHGLCPGALGSGEPSFPARGRMGNATSPRGIARGIRSKPFKTRSLLGYTLPPTPACDCIKTTMPNGLGRRLASNYLVWHCPCASCQLLLGRVLRDPAPDCRRPPERRLWQSLPAGWGVPAAPKRCLARCSAEFVCNASNDPGLNYLVQLILKYPEATRVS